MYTKQSALAEVYAKTIDYNYNVDELQWWRFSVRLVSISYSTERRARLVL